MLPLHETHVGLLVPKWCSLLGTDRNRGKQALELNVDFVPVVEFRGDQVSIEEANVVDVVFEAVLLAALGLPVSVEASGVGGKVEALGEGSLLEEGILRISLKVLRRGEQDNLVVVRTHHTTDFVT